MFGIRSGYEQTAYTVIDQVGERIEVRQYRPQLVAEVVVEATDEKSGRSAAFRALFDYISGANRLQAKVAMTAPVEAGTASEKIAMTVPVETGAQPEGRYVMRFFLPAGYTLKTAPQPIDPRVTLRELPERTLAVLRFTGSTGTDNVARQLVEMENAIAGTTWRPSGAATAMFYDPPWTIPFLHRNEVAVEVARG
jgi:hypothetical protein